MINESTTATPIGLTYSEGKCAEFEPLPAHCKPTGCPAVLKSINDMSYAVCPVCGVLAGVDDKGVTPHPRIKGIVENEALKGGEK